MVRQNKTDKFSLYSASKSLGEISVEAFASGLVATATVAVAAILSF